MMVGLKATKAVEKINKKQLKKKLKKKKMFEVAFPKKDDEDSDEDGEEWLQFFKMLDEEDLYSLSQVEFEPMAKKTDMAA